GCSLDGCSAVYANLGKTILERTSITDSRCKEAFVQEARLKHTRLDGVDLTRADFFRTSLKGVDLSGCTIDGISVSEDFRELKGAKVSPEQAVGLAMLLGVTIV
ncbi:MAG: pentapeptide repeat-containing protein, partial [Atopobiaceae bacterium]|nr:pentapeptide repeat-containing protein [Atopobiaceae bacterium]